MFKDKYGPWALVAGGSDGIGAAFAREVCARGLNVILLARGAQNLEKIAAELSEDYPNVSVQTLAVDLGAAEATDKIIKATADKDVGLFIYNVGSEPNYGDFLGHDIEFVRGRLFRNFVIKTELLHHYASKMKVRGGGGVLVMGSISGFFGSPGFSLYAGSKAFTRYLMEGLWYEFKELGIDCLCPVVGITNTPTMTENYGALPDDVAQPSHIAKSALDKLGDGPLWVSEDIVEQVEAFIPMAPRDRAEIAAKAGKEFASGSKVTYSK